MQRRLTKHWLVSVEVETLKLRSKMAAAVKISRRLGYFRSSSKKSCRLEKRVRELLLTARRKASLALRIADTDAYLYPSRFPSRSIEGCMCRHLRSDQRPHPRHAHMVLAYAEEKDESPYAYGPRSPKPRHDKKKKERQMRTHPTPLSRSAIPFSACISLRSARAVGSSPQAAPPIARTIDFHSSSRVPDGAGGYDEAASG
ncbi:hypothetical protein B0H13DRAFT_1890758 [Mycena leptocephala]|nr:hypothetical protein B0H13DRAFT_1890758 [Mycena leptocephala]